MNKLSFSLIIISFILGLTLGFALSPEYTFKMKNRQSAMRELGNPDKFLDQRYLDNLIAHHQSAIYMSKQVEANSKRKEMVDLAKEIIKVDEVNIKELYIWKKSWYQNTRTINSFEKINLGSYDEKFDLRFLNALIAHHDEAIMGAKEVRTKTQRNEVLNLADSIIEGLTKNKEAFLKYRLTWYQI